MTKWKADLLKRKTPDAPPRAVVARSTILKRGDVTVTAIADLRENVAACASCGKPVRVEAAMRRGGVLWHQHCPRPEGCR